VSQAAIFFTLFAALLKKMEVDKMDNYDQAMFGTVLIFVNCVGVVMVVGGWLVKPVGRLVKKLGEKHVHEAALKGVGEEHDEWSKFEAYFRELVESGREEAAWETIHVKDWRLVKGKAEARQWLEETGVVGEWRSANGDGPRDQFRVVFEVDHGLEEVYEHLTSWGKVEGSTLDNHSVKDYGYGVMDMYYAARMPWPLSARDFLLERHAWLRGSEALVLTRSKGDSDAGLKQSARGGRVRGHVDVSGYFLERAGAGRTRMVYITGADLMGLMELDWVNKRAGLMRMAAVVASTRKLGKEKVKDVEEGGNFVTRQLRAISSGAVQLGGDWAKKRREKEWEKEYEKKPRAKEDENWEPPPPPPEGPAPTWDNNLFTNGKGLAAREIEMRSNPMHGERAEEAVKAEKDTRHLDRMVSGGFKAKKPGPATPKKL